MPDSELGDDSEGLNWQKCQRTFSGETFTHVSTCSSYGDPIPPAPDGGWGWVVIACSFFAHCVADGTTFAFGVLQINMVHFFNQGTGKTAFVGSLYTSVPLLVAPLASVVVERGGCRNAVIIGGVVASIGFILSTFAPTVEVLCITIGIISGLGLSLIFVAAIVILAFYFEKRRSLATGLATCGSGIGCFVFAPMLERLIENYGFRGTCLLVGGIFLHLCICGALMRPLEWSKNARVCASASNSTINTPSSSSVKNTALSSKNTSDIPGSEYMRLLVGDVVVPCVTEHRTARRNSVSMNDLSVVPHQHFRTTELHSISEDHNENAVHNGIIPNSHPSRTTVTKRTTSICIEDIVNGNANRVPSEQVLLEDSKIPPSIWIDDVAHDNVTEVQSSKVTLKNSKHSHKMLTHSTTCLDDINMTPNCNYFHGARSGLQSLSGTKGKSSFKQEYKNTPKVAQNGTVKQAKSLPNINVIERHLHNRKHTSQRHRNSASYFFRRPSVGRVLSIPCPSLNVSTRPCKHSVTTSSQQRNAPIETVWLKRKDLMPGVTKGVGMSLLERLTKRELHVQPSHLSRPKTVSCPDVYLSYQKMPHKHHHRKSKKSVEDIIKILKSMCNFSMLSNLTFLLFWISNLILYMWYDIPYLYIADHATSMDISDEKSTFLLSIIGIANTAGLVLLGYTGDQPNINPTFIYALSICVCGVATFMVPFVYSYTLLVIYSSIYGFFISGNYALTSVILCNLIGVNRLTAAYGLICMGQGIANLLGPPLAGWLHDLTGNYHTSFYVAGVFIFASGLILAGMPCARRLQMRRKMSQQLKQDKTVVAGNALPERRGDTLIVLEYETTL